MYQKRDVLTRMHTCLSCYGFSHGIAVVRVLRKGIPDPIARRWTAKLPWKADISWPLIEIMGIKDSAVTVTITTATIIIWSGRIILRSFVLISFWSIVLFFACISVGTIVPYNRYWRRETTIKPPVWLGVSVSSSPASAASCFILRWPAGGRSTANWPRPGGLWKTLKLVPYCEESLSKHVKTAGWFFWLMMTTMVMTMVVVMP